MHAPIQGFMDAKIDESMTSQIQVKLIEKKTKKTLLDDIGKSAETPPPINLCSLGRPRYLALAPRI